MGQLSPKKKLIIRGNIQQKLKERGWTQKYLEEISGVPQTTISRFDNSKSHSDLTLFLLARAFQCPIEELFLVEEVDET